MGSLEDLAAEFEQIRGFQELVDIAVKDLAPKILANFNDWATRTVYPLLDVGFTLGETTKITYDGVDGFVIHMGPVEKEGRAVTRHFNRKAYEAVLGYKRSSPWVSRIISCLDTPC
ncbi:MAG: hypothetical protein ACP5NS_00045 [Candidatus Pacearchaeota archaeon]